MSKKAIIDASGVFEATELIVSSEKFRKIHDFSDQEGQEIKCRVRWSVLHRHRSFNLRKMHMIATVKCSEEQTADINTQIGQSLSRYQHLPVKKTE
jgi:hypothetical protein